MPIRIPDALPATSILEGENIFVMTEHRAMHQDIRPLRVLLLNLMPTKIVTETQIMRKLSNTPLQIGVELLRIAKPSVQKCFRRSSGNVLSHVRRGEGLSLRRHDYHRRPGGDFGLRDGGLLV